MDVKLFKRHNVSVYGPIFKIFGPKLVASYPLLSFIMFLKCCYLPNVGGPNLHSILKPYHDVVLEVLRVPGGDVGVGDLVVGEHAGDTVLQAAFI